MDKKILPEIIQKEADAYLAAIIASTSDAVIGKDLDGNITFWSPAAKTIFGFTEEEMMGKHIGILIPEDKLAEYEHLMGQVRRGEIVDHVETVRQRKDGKLVSISATISPIKNKDGVIIGASKVARDITGDINAERTSAYLSAIIESSDDAIIAKDLSGFVTAWNKSAERIFGYSEKEIVGKHITLLIPSERLHEEDKILVTLKAGERIDHFETIRRHKSGQLIPVSLTVSPIRNLAGNIVGASKIARDISVRIRAEESLRETSRKKDDFVANMSHELRTPMNAVIGLSNLLYTMEGMPAKAVKFVETLKTSADHLMNLIDDLLDFAKIEDESFEIESVKFNLPELIEKIVSVANVKVQEKGLEIYVRLSPALRRHYIGDPLRLHQVLMNLLSNAIKFTNEGSVELDISDAPAGADAETRVTFRVSDTGIGIPPDKLETIFEKFTQADSSITRKYGGSGLGLAIAQTCVRKMGGTLTVESRLGVGTTFMFSLPLPFADDASTVGKFSMTKTPVKPAQKKNILLVEDYEANVVVVSALLEQLGYDYDIAQNGLDAVRKYLSIRYDVILMDVQMNEMDGFEATKRIRQIENEKNFQRIPIIAMTAHVTEQDKDKCLDVGMDDFISKPFDHSLLSQKIARYIAINKKRQ